MSLYHVFTTSLSNSYKKLETEKFKDTLMHLRAIIEEIEKINIIERLETQKIKEIAKKRTKENKK